MERVLRYVITLIIICLIINCANADEIDSINEMFDNIQKAHRLHDIDLLSAQYSYEGLLLIGEYPDPTQGAFAFEKNRVLKAVQNQVWPVNGLLAREVTARRIAVKNDLAFIHIMVTDKFSTGKVESSEQFVIAVKRDSHWRVCFSMPAIMSVRAEVVSIETDSPADKAKLKTGDIIIACNGEDLDPVLFSIDPITIINRKGATSVSLLIQRSGSTIDLQAPSGLKGAKLKSILTPAGSAKMLSVSDTHPVKALVKNEIEILKTGDVNSYKGILCDSGFFSFRRELGAATRLITSENALEMISKQLSESRKALDVSTIHIENTDVIATSDIALAVGTIQADERSGTPLRVPTRLEVYIRSGQRWCLAANLVERFQFASGGGVDDMDL